MKTKFLLLTLFIGLLSCSNDENFVPYALPYYQFTAEERTKTLNSISVESEMIFKNQANEIIVFKAYYSFFGKDSHKRGCWVRCSTIFYYDTQNVKMSYTYDDQYSSTLELTVKKYPIGHNYDIHPPALGTPTFIGYIKFPLWNKPGHIIINFNEPTLTISFNNKTYTKVRIFESNSIDILNPDALPPLLPKNVNKIYYDDNHGIIGFDDLNNNNWRIQ